MNIPKAKAELSPTIKSGGKKPIRNRAWKKAPHEYMNIKTAIGAKCFVYMKMILKEATAMHPGITKSARLSPQSKLYVALNAARKLGGARNGRNKWNTPKLRMKACSPAVMVGLSKLLTSRGPLYELI